MPVTLADIDARLTQLSPALHANHEVTREVAWMRVDWLLDLRLETVPS